MPVQKGKKRKRTRRRGPHNDVDAAETSVPAATAPRSARPIMRRGWQPPMWANLVIGVVLLAAGIYFYQFPAKGLNSNLRLVFLLGYLALGGMYFYRALKQFRDKRQ